MPCIEGVVGNVWCGKRPLPERLSRTILSRYIISYGTGAGFSTFVYGHGTGIPTYIICIMYI